MRRSSESRRVWRQRIRVAGGALLFVTGSLAALSASFSPAASLTHVSRSLREDATPFNLHLHMRAKESEATNATATNATTTTTESEGECGTLAAWEENGGIFVYIFLLSYLFVALAIVCDDYFVTSLERITEALGLSQDVAGATFMAAGSSAPELFVSLADNVFTKPQASLGIGTIVGSAIFNILVIISLSALLAGQVLDLDWRPMLRDSLWYCWAIVLLTHAIWDGKVDVVESVIMVISYIAYIVYMSQNERVVKLFCKRPEDDADLGTPKDDDVDAIAAQAADVVDASVNVADTEKRAWTIDVERVDHAARRDDNTRLSRQSSHGGSTSATQHSHPHRLGSQSKLNPMFQSKYRMFQYHHSHSMSQASSNDIRKSASNASTDSGKATVSGSLRPLNVDSLAAAVTQADAQAAAKAEIAKHESTVKEEEGEEELGGYFDEVFDVPKGFFPLVWFVITRPIVVAMRLTIPDARYPRFSGTAGFTATFLISILWIAVLSHYTVVWATKFGCIAGIPSPLMGLTILAAGTSIPDAMSSILVARAGHGDMAVSNALGSNVFDVLLGLGLPFFVSNLVYSEPVPIDTGDIEFSIFMLFGVLVLVVVLLMASKWRLHPIAGGVLAVMYVVYVVVSYLRGM